MNNMFKKLSIRFKVVLISAILAAVFLAVPFGYGIINTRSILLDSAKAQIQYGLAFEKYKIEILSTEVRQSLFLLKGTPPIQGIIRAEEGGGHDRAGNSSYEEWRTRLEDIFTSEINAKGLYDQLRYIDENGKELVRVDYINGEGQVIPDADLQEKGNRNYFLDAIKLSDGGVYVSRMELNREGIPPTISIPYKPTIRYATPIFSNRNGSLQGIIIANVLVNPVINKGIFDNTNKEGIRTFVLDQDGFFILHPDKNKEWGGPNNLNSGANVLTEFGKMGQKLNSEENGIFFDEKNFYFLLSVNAGTEDSPRTGKIIRLVPRQYIFNQIDQIIRRLILIAMGSFIVLFFLFFYVIGRLLKPLKELVSASEKLAEGDYLVKVNVKNSDEIGKLAQSFNNMVRKLKTVYRSQETEIKEKTLDLDNKVKELQKTQIAMTNVLGDISSEKKKIEIILESIGDGVFVIDRNGQIIIFNQVSEALTGYSSEEAIGKHYKDILHFLDEETLSVKDEFIQKAFKTGEIQELDQKTLLQQRNGEKIAISDSVAPIKNSKNEVIGLVVIFRDVSKEREIDKAKTEFVSLASHQLRTPLTSMRLFSDLLLGDKKIKLTKKQKEYLGNIKISTQRMIRLVNDLLNVSRLESGRLAIKPEPVDFIKLVKDTLIEVEGIAKEANVDVQFSCDIKKMNKLSIDSSLVHEVLVSLLSNAVRYSSGDSSGKVLLTVQKTDTECICSIQDNGIGIPKKEQKNMFKKFFRADNAVAHDADGSGLGLYIAKKIMDAGGGRIWFESEEGKGTTFFFAIPLQGMKQKEGEKGIAK